MLDPGARAARRSTDHSTKRKETCSDTCRQYRDSRHPRRHGGCYPRIAPYHTLIVKYFQILLDDGKLPAAICFYAEGVRLACAGSPALDVLRALEAAGVRLIVCTTCLNFYGLVEQRAVGLAGSMGDIVEAQWRADKVITI